MPQTSVKSSTKILQANASAAFGGLAGEKFVNVLRAYDFPVSQERLERRLDRDRNYRCG
jgi:hypothetical protein